MIRNNKLINNITDDIKGGYEDHENVDLMNPIQNDQVTTNGGIRNKKGACKIW